MTLTGTWEGCEMNDNQYEIEVLSFSFSPLILVI